MPKVTKYVSLHKDDGETVNLAPGDDLPEGFDADALNPAIFEDDKVDVDEDGNPDVVAGPGLAAPDEEDAETAKARKAAEAARKRKQRADKKASDEEALRLAEEREAAEREAAEKAQRDADAAAQGDPNGNSQEQG